MMDLPLFPLDTVLFPGMPLTLHIFEERYRQMIQECMQGGALFGVVLIKEGVEALGPLPEPHRIGCIAEIAQIQSLQDGRMNLVAVGRQRFQILSLHRDRPYLRAVVEQFPLEANPAQGTAEATQRLLPRVEEYLAMLSAAGDVGFDISALPVDPETLAYLAATVLQIPNERKQDLLATVSEYALLAELQELYRRELPVLRLLLQEDDPPSPGPIPFSMN